MSEQTTIRAALLRFYHSDLIAHAGYLLTSTLAAITFFANYGNIRNLQPLLRIFDQWPCIERIFISFVIAGFLFLHIFLLTGVLWWAYLANAIIHLVSAKNPTFHSLQNEAAHYVRGKHWGKKTRSTLEVAAALSRSKLRYWAAFGFSLWGLLIIANYSLLLAVIEGVIAGICLIVMEKRSKERGARRKVQATLSFFHSIDSD